MNQQKMYLQVVEKTLELVTDRLLLFFQHKQKINEQKWAKQVRKCYKALKKMETTKNLGQISVKMEVL